MTNSIDGPAVNSGPSNELLSFTVRSQLLALPVHTIQEVRSYEKPTPLPRSAPECQGVLNLRGCFVPVVDLGLLLGLSALQVTAKSIIVVVQLAGRHIGFAVDEVNDVANYNANEVHAAPANKDSRLANCIAGLLTRDGAPMQLLNVQVLNTLLSAGTAVSANMPDFQQAA